MEKNCVGAIVCKLDMHKKMFRRGYIAMLAVDSKFRRKGIGMRVSFLVKFSLALKSLFMSVLNVWSCLNDVTRPFSFKVNWFTCRSVVGHT